MICPKCSGITDVADSRRTKAGVRRRRRCRSCDYRFTTYEATEEAFELPKIAKQIRADMRKAILLLNENAERFIMMEREICSSDEFKKDLAVTGLAITKMDEDGNIKHIPTEEYRAERESK